MMLLDRVPAIKIAPALLEIAAANQSDGAQMVEMLLARHQDCASSVGESGGKSGM